MENILNFEVVILIALIGVILLCAHNKKKIDLSAIIATIAVGLICLIAFGAKGVWPLLLFFVIGNIFSHYKKDRKKKLGVEQEIRTWKNVVSNGGAAAIFAFSYIWAGYPVYFLGLMGAMACALADTSATELGQVYGKTPRLIKNLKRVPVGTAGAVSDEGFIFALIGSGLICLPLLLWGYPAGIFLICLIGGFIGAVFDSVLGCTVERKGDINATHAINYVTTFFSGIIVVYSCG